jgi:hypothetical protein
MPKTFPVYYHDKKIGNISYDKQYDWWSSECYISDIGHLGHSTQKEARDDVIKMYKENRQNIKDKIKEQTKFLKEN